MRKKKLDIPPGPPPLTFSSLCIPLNTNTVDVLQGADDQGVGQGDDPSRRSSRDQLYGADHRTQGKHTQVSGEGNRG